MCMCTQQRTLTSEHRRKIYRMSLTCELSPLGTTFGASKKTSDANRVHCVTTMLYTICVTQHDIILNTYLTVIILAHHV